MTPEDQHTFSAQAIKCLEAMRDFSHSNPIESHPWGGRPHILSRRFIMQKYLTSEDIVQAFWIQEQALRANPADWWKEPGLSHLSALMDERSRGTWRDEADAYAKSTPTVMGYIELEYGDAIRQAHKGHRAAAAEERRAAFTVVSSD